MVAKIAFFMFPPVSAVSYGQTITAAMMALCGIRELSKIAQSQIPAIWLRLRARRQTEAAKAEAPVWAVRLR
jgi:hypothetical protein